MDSNPWSRFLYSPEKVRFAPDSPLEGSGFEPSVPRQKDNAFEASPAPASRFVADRCKEGHSEASLINAEGVVSSSPTCVVTGPAQ
jgi:hypothetical protein